MRAQPRITLGAFSCPLRAAIDVLRLANGAVTYMKNHGWVKDYADLFRDDPHEDTPTWISAWIMDV